MNLIALPTYPSTTISEKLLFNRQVSQKKKKTVIVHLPRSYPNTEGFANSFVAARLVFDPILMSGSVYPHSAVQGSFSLESSIGKHEAELMLSFTVAGGVQELGRR